jgi:hypothetical protein
VDVGRQIGLASLLWPHWTVVNYYNLLRLVWVLVNYANLLLSRLGSSKLV